MNEIQKFYNPLFGELRTLETADGKVLICGADAANALGYQNTSKALSDHCKEDGVTFCYITDSLGREQKAKFITEGNLYRLITHSKLPDAERFETWVFDEVLTTIRKHGAYMTPDILEKTIQNPDFLIGLLVQLKEEQEKSQKLQVQVSTLTVENQIMQPKADYFDELVDRNLLTNLRDTAKELGIKQKKFVQMLLDRKYLYRDKRSKLKPYSNHVENGIFEIKEFSNSTTGYVDNQTLVTPKGRETFRLLFIGA